MKNVFTKPTLTLGLCLGCIAWPFSDLHAQSKLYPRLFDLQEVTLENGVFKTAMDLNYNTLLEYDVDRLLTPYMRQAGFTEWEQQHPNFTNWGSGNFRLDGHVGGHYLSALALAYASSKDESVRAKMKERMDYMVDKMAECQAVFDTNTDGLYGYIGGLPDNNVWTGIYHGNLGAYNSNRGNVPLYTMHKVYAGLRDAWMYGGNEKAKECFLKLCDWGVNLISNLDDATVQSILDTEHGGINEMYVDAYQMTGEEKTTKRSLLKRTGEFIWNSIGAIFRGEFLIRLRFYRYFLHIVWIFILAIASIWIKLEIDRTMARMEETKEELEDYKIYYAQKTCELVALDRLSTVQDMLEKAGSDLTVPDRPADRIR